MTTITSENKCTFFLFHPVYKNNLKANNEETYEDII
jgi:hypothetical protein